MSINIVTAPVRASVYYEISLYSIFINLLVIPLMTMLLWMGLLAILTGYIWLDAGRFFIGTSVYILKIYEKICEINGELPYHTLYVKEPEKVTVWCYYTLLVVALLCFAKLGYKYASRKYSRTYMEMGGCFVAIIMMILIVRTDTETLATFIDVGQGDCAFLNIEGCRILVDGGSSDVKSVGEYRIVPCIRSMGYGKVDVVIVSHIDNDHISGIKEIIENDLLEIGVVILSSGSNKGFIEFLDTHNIRYKFVESGDSITFSDVRIDIVHPAGDYPGDTNRRSLVCYLRSDDINILFTGDISSEEDKIVVDAMLSRYGAEGIDVDILKVAHHGSKYSTSSEFLEKLGAKKAVISCGIDNSYGHPHNETLLRLEDVGCNTFITSKSGAVRIYKGNRVEEWN